jgi:antitoxin component YwqK of YwqJK toxin-antitoxin module
MSTAVNCILCKDVETADTPFMVKGADCTCSNEMKNIHIRCAKLFMRLHESIIKKYCNGCSMCRECSKSLSTATKYTIGDETISVHWESCESYQGWQPSEEMRTDVMRSSNCTLNICLKYNYQKKTTNKYEIWYFPMKKEFTKPLLMKLWETNSRGFKEGEFKIYYTNGNLHLSSKYLNNMMTNECINYYLDGKIKSNESYVRGNKHGLVLEYERTGLLTRRYTMQNGNKHGHYESWWSNESKHMDWYYDNNKNDYTKHLCKWHPNKVIDEEFTPLDERDATGKQIIRWLSYYTDNAKLKHDFKCVYDESFNGKLRPIDYPHYIYHLNGSIKEKRTLLANGMIKHENFHSNGKKSEIFYQNRAGLLDGMYASWYTSGSREILCIYNKGHYCDEYAKWDSDGHLIKFGRYDSLEKYDPIHLAGML